MMELSGAVCLTPLGPFAFIEQHGKVIRSGFTDDTQQLADEIDEPLGDAHSSPTALLIDRYFEGDLEA
ncbi:MAG: hypothetical protein H0U53_07395, partial [Actinobacteria bacterium]|nr:hypothetical protein [Actinomycetota bacterium]